MTTENSTKIEEITRFWRHVFGGQRGQLQIWTGIRNGNDIPEETIKVQNFSYPTAAETAAKWALDKSEEGREVYFCAHLLTRWQRVKENAGEVITLWGEQDGADLPNGDLRPSAVVESSPGHYHVYWRLTDPIPPKTAENLNKRLAKEIDADSSGFDLTQLLRVPGTANYKYPERHAVKMNYIDGALSYEPGNLDARLPQIEEPEVEDIEEEDGPPVVLGEKALKVWRGEEPVLIEEGERKGEVDRSKTLMKIGRTLFDAGAKKRVVAEALRERDIALGYNKYTSNRDGGQREYLRICEKLEKEGRNTRAEITVNRKRGNSKGSNDSNDSDFRDFVDLPDPTKFPAEVLPRDIKQFVEEGAAMYRVPHRLCGIIYIGCCICRHWRHPTSSLEEEVGREPRPVLHDNRAIGE